MRNAQNFDFFSLKKSIPEHSNYARNEIILLGSSLFIYPIWDLDRKKGIQSSDANHHHEAVYLSHKLRTFQSSANIIFNLAVGGAMVSDYYLLFSKYLSQTKNNPQWAVVDCAPRSFCDSGMNNPCLTPIFEYFFDETDLFSSGKYYLPSLGAGLEFLAERYCYLYRHRKWLSESLIEYLRHSAEFCRLSSVKTGIVNGNNKMQTSLQEYRWRYFGISQKAIELQLYFLNLIADLCKDRRIKLLLVNMPLSEPNKSLLNAQFYADYVSCIRNITRRENQEIYFLDLNNGNQYKISDFNDSVHLNASGAVKFENQIADFINNVAK